MDVRNSVDALKTLLGSPAGTTPTGTPPARSGSPAVATSLSGDRATVSSAGSEVSQAASAPEVRMEKVAAVQVALADGTYHVSSAAVAGKVVDAMLKEGEMSRSEPSASE